MNDGEKGDEAIPLGETTGGDTRRLGETKSDSPLEGEGGVEEFTGGDTR